MLVSLNIGVYGRKYSHVVTQFTIVTSLGQFLANIYISNHGQDFIDIYLPRLVYTGWDNIKAHRVRNALVSAPGIHISISPARWPLV